jgi:hypothetical protein
MTPEQIETIRNYVPKIDETKDALAAFDALIERNREANRVLVELHDEYEKTKGARAVAWASLADYVESHVMSIAETKEQSIGSCFCGHRVEYLPRVACETCPSWRPNFPRCNHADGMESPNPDGSDFCSRHPALAHLIGGKDPADET